MTDERKCPLCGAGYTSFGACGDPWEEEADWCEWSFGWQQCLNPQCNLPCRFWDRIERLRGLLEQWSERRPLLIAAVSRWKGAAEDDLGDLSDLLDRSDFEVIRR